MASRLIRLATGRDAAKLRRGSASKALGFSLQECVINALFLGESYVCYISAADTTP